MSLNSKEGDNVKLLELPAIQMAGDGRSRGKGAESSPYGKGKTKQHLRSDAKFRDCAAFAAETLAQAKRSGRRGEVWTGYE